MNRSPDAPTTPDAKASRPLPRWKAIGFGAVVTVLCVGAVFGVLELTFRTLTLREMSLDWLRWHPTRLYINNPDLPDVYWDTEWNVNSMGFRGPEVGAKTRRRILCLGDSSTFGFKAPYELCYPQRVERALPEYEVINAGTFGYTSYQGRRVFEETRQSLRPDVVTLAFGFNDRRYVVQPDLADGEEAFRALYRLYSWHSFFLHSRVYQALMFRRVESRIRTHPPITTLVPRVDTLHYRENLEAVMQTCQEKGIRVVLIYTGEKPDLNRGVDEGIAALERGATEEALARFEEARHWKGEDAKVMGTYYLVLTLQYLGRFEEADALQFDYPFAYYFPGVNPIRSSHSYVKVLRELAEAYHTPLLIYREIVREDSQYYLDECHPTVEGYGLLAERLVEAIRGMNLAPQP